MIKLNGNRLSSLKALSRAPLWLVAVMIAFATGASLWASESSADRTWILSGYLPSAPSQKVFLTLSGKKIKNISPKAPSIGLDVPEGTLHLSTNDLIFPGLIDMHNHVKYNVLPLWNQALGQFTNRFEWREKFEAYKDAVSFNMKPIRGDTVCAAVRWAEIKALTGGVTAIQGIGNDSKCAKDFGIHNLEIVGEFENRQKIRAMTDLIIPGLIGSVFEPLIQPFMSSDASSYDNAYERMLKEQGVLDWIERFVNEPHTLANGLRLLTGEAHGLKGDEQGDETEKLFADLTPRLESRLTAAPFSFSLATAGKQIANMRAWLLGPRGDGKGGYLEASATESKAYEFLSKGGVLTITSAVRRYIGRFEHPIRQSALKYLNQKDSLAIIAHLAEGRRDDAYNQLEYRYLRKFDLARKGMVLIHAVGLSKQDFESASEAGISIVWSPFSNLLLYGQTLDVVAARDAGINIAIGADWSPTGSKNLMDELKIARRYLDFMGIREIDDRELVEMATLNAARAIRLEQVIGRVAEGYQADLLLVPKKRKKNPYTTLIQSTQDDVSLVVVNGQPLYGDPEMIEEAAKYWEDARTPESLPLGAPPHPECKMRKSLRLPFLSAYDESLGKETGAPELYHLEGIRAELVSKMGAYAQSVRDSGNERQIQSLVELDSIYHCEDPAYAARFGTFVELELELNASRRSDLRATANLSDDWSPLPVFGSDNDHDEDETEENEEEGADHDE